MTKNNVVNSPATNPSLYRVETTVVGFKYGGAIFDNVVIAWFTERAETIIPYNTAIEDYDNLTEEERRYPEAAIHEIFIENEAVLLKQFLDEHRGGITIIEKIPLPIEKDAMPFGSVAVGGLKNLLTLSRSQDYTLDFFCMGYFNVRGCPLKLDEDDMYLELLTSSPS